MAQLPASAVEVSIGSEAKRGTLGDVRIEQALVGAEYTLRYPSRYTPCWIFINLQLRPCAALTITRSSRSCRCIIAKKVEPGDHMKLGNTIYIMRNINTCGFRYSVPFIRFQKPHRCRKTLKSATGSLVAPNIQHECNRIRICHSRRRNQCKCPWRIYRARSCHCRRQELSQIHSV